MTAEKKLELPADCARRYEAVRVLGSGGFGAAVLAFDRELSRSVVVKVLFGLEPDVVARFQREARVTANLQHENVVKVLDHGATDNVPWIVYEYVEGRTLRQRLDAGRVPVAEAVEVVRQVARALEAAHAQAIVHRDVKPENVLVEPNGRYRLIDFGIAKGGTGRTVDTSPGVVLGSPGYLSPEAISGDTVDHRSDVYALGVVFYELLAGRPPFISSSAMQVLTAHLNDAPPQLRGFAPEVPPPLEALVARCLAKRPADRVQSAAELLGELGRVTAGPARPGPTTALPADRSSVTRTRQLDASRSVPLSAQASAATALTSRPRIPVAPKPRALARPAIAAGVALALVIGGGIAWRATRPVPPPPPPPSAPARPPGLEPAETAPVTQRVIEIYRRISARTQNRIAKVGAILAEPNRVARDHDLPESVVRECVEDFHYLDDWLKGFDERFPDGAAPADRPLSLRARAKRYTILAFLADMSAESHLAALEKVDPALRKLLPGCQAERCFQLFADYLGQLPAALEACARDPRLHAVLPELLDDHAQIGRTVHAYPWCESFDRRVDRRVKQSQEQLLALARDPGPAGVLAKLAHRAWDRSERPMFRKYLKVAHAEASALLATQEWLAAPIRDKILQTAFKEN